MIQMEGIQLMTILLLYILGVNVTKNKRYHDASRDLCIIIRNEGSHSLPIMEEDKICAAVISGMSKNNKTDVDSHVQTHVK